MSDKNLDYYLSLYYTYQVTWDEDSQAYGALVVELPGCVATGKTPAEAIESLEEAKQAYLEVALTEGWEIPEPAQVLSYSGKVLLRMASSLHMQLAQWAQQEGVSLNQLLVTVLAHAAGTRLQQSSQIRKRDVIEAFLETLEKQIVHARLEIERGAAGEAALAPLREYLLSIYSTMPAARSLLSLVDLATQAYRLAEMRTFRKERYALANQRENTHVAERKEKELQE